MALLLELLWSVADVSGAASMRMDEFEKTLAMMSVMQVEMVAVVVCCLFVGRRGAFIHLHGCRRGFGIGFV